MRTLVLYMTVVMTAVQKKSLAQGAPNLASLTIGFAVFLSHLVLVPLAGCGINPARTFGPAVVNVIAGVGQPLLDLLYRSLYGLGSGGGHFQNL